MAQHLGDVLDELGIGDHEGGHGLQLRAAPAGGHGLLAIVHDEPGRRAVHHQPALVGDVQQVRRGVLHGVDGGFVHHALGQVHLGLAGPHMDVFPGHAHVDLLDLGIGLQLRRGDGVPHALDHLAGGVPVPVRIAIVGHRAGTDDVQSVHAAALRNHRHDFGGSKLNGCNLRLHSRR